MPLQLLFLQYCNRAVTDAVIADAAVAAAPKAVAEVSAAGAAVAARREATVAVLLLQ